MANRFAPGRLIRSAVLVAGLAALLVGCSQASVPAADTSSQQGAAAPAAQVAGASSQTDYTSSAANAAVQEVKVDLTEWSINLSSSTVQAGLVRFALTNTGNAPHALAIAGNGVDRRSGNLSGGQSETLEVELKPGTYQIWCPVGNHKDRGMVAEFTVQ